MYRLSASLPYILTRAGVRMGDLFSRELAEIGMTLQMYRVLAALWERDELRLGELSEMIDVELSTLSRLITTMKGMNLVSRRRLASDNRAIRIALTAGGRKQVEALIPRAQHYEALATHGFSAAEVEALRKALARVLGNLKEATGDVAAAAVEDGGAR